MNLVMHQHTDMPPARRDNAAACATLTGAVKPSLRPFSLASKQQAYVMISASTGML